MKKHLLLLAAVALAAASQAQTTTVDNYTYDFNKPFGDTDSYGGYVLETAAPENWNHKADDGDGYYSFPPYYYRDSEGVDGTGCLQAGNQSAYDEDYEEYVDLYDLLITPKVSGNITVMVKKYFSSGTVKFYTMTNNGGSFERGAEIKAQADADLSTSSYAKVSFNLDAPSYVGIRIENAYIDNFTAEHAEIAGTVTTINALTKSTKEARQWTNLNGQRVGSNYHGIVISKGIKVLKK